MALATDLVTVTDVADHLQWSVAQQVQYADQMARFISAATTVVEEISGPVVGRAFDEYYSGGSQRIQLDNYPIQTVTSVTESWGSTAIWTLSEQPVDGSESMDAYGYTVDYQKGLIYRRYSGVAGSFASGVMNVHVQYTAGMCADTASVPANIALATLELIRFNWQPIQGGNRPSPQTDGLGGAGTFAGFFVPNRVMELLRPNANRFGIA